MRNFAVVLLVLVCFAVAETSSAKQFERILLPVITTSTPGGYGSVWTTRLVVRNGSDLPATFEFPFGCVLGTCARGIQIPPRSAADTQYLTPPQVSSPGLLVYVERPQNTAFAFNLRAQDLSRQSLTWGTELPAIRESEAFTGPMELLNMPLDERFRCHLRVYDLDARPASRIRIRVLPADSESILAEFELTLTASVDENVERPFYPGYATFSGFPQLPALSDHESVRLTLQPLTEGLRYWGFISVTNNETQHVTTITPQ